jgi:hypothetical protein
LQGAFTAALTFGVGEISGAHAASAAGRAMTLGERALQVGGHAVVGCASGAMAGGSCKAGAMSAGFSALAGPHLPGGGSQSFHAGNMLARVAVGAIASTVGGGKAENGAMSAAFEYLFNEFATFDGKRLRLFSDEGLKLGEWDAVSGKTGYQSKENQSLSFKGPLPEGVYDVRQGDYQEYPNNPTLIDTLKSAVFRGAWPGGLASWGPERVWLSPLVGDTFGRDKFSIHGGLEFGSAGCVDLAIHSRSFFRAFQATGQDIRLYVKYGSDKWLSGY